MKSVNVLIKCFIMYIKTYIFRVYYTCVKPTNLPVDVLSVYASYLL